MVRPDGLQPYYVGRPVAGALFYAAIAVLAVIQLRQQFHSRAEATRSDRASLAAVGVSMLLANLAGALIALSVPGAGLPGGVVTFGIGLVLTWTGVCLRWWCFHALGHYFTFTVMTSPDQQVVASGPYSVVRHPSYSGLLMLLVGIAIVVDTNWISVAVVLAISGAGLAYRIHVEEAALTAALGSAYTTYAAHRKRLIPLVW